MYTETQIVNLQIEVGRLKNKVEIIQGWIVKTKKLIEKNCPHPEKYVIKKSQMLKDDYGAYAGTETTTECSLCDSLLSREEKYESIAKWKTE